jgi:hypothetical protein
MDTISQTINTLYIFPEIPKKFPEKKRDKLPTV